MKKYLMGIDGGGSYLRGVIADRNLNLLYVDLGATAKPKESSFRFTQAHITETMQGALQQLALLTENIAAVGIGIAGAPVQLAGQWLRDTVATVCPSAVIVCSMD